MKYTEMTTEELLEEKRRLESIVITERVKQLSKKILHSGGIA